MKNTKNHHGQTRFWQSVSVCLFVWLMSIGFALSLAIGTAQAQELKLEILNGHSGGGVLAVAVSSDGKFALTGSTDQTALLWDLETGKQLRRFVGHEDAVSAVQFSKDGRFVLTASYDKTARLWETATGKPVVLTVNRNGIFAGHTGKILSAAISADGAFAATASEDKTARIWDASSGRQLFSIEYVGGVNSIAFSPDSRLLLTGGEDKIARLYEVKTGALVRQFVGHTGEITSVAYSPDGKQVLTGSIDITVMLWNVETAKLFKKFLTELSNQEFFLERAYVKVLFTKSGNKVIASNIEKVFCWEIDSGKECWQIDGGASTLSITPDEKKILYAVGGFYRTEFPAWIFGITENKIIGELDGKLGTVSDIDVAFDFHKILISRIYNAPSLWNLVTGKATIIENQTEAQIIKFSPDSKIFALQNSNGLQIFDSNTLKLIKLMDNSDLNCRNAFFSPDQKKILAGCQGIVVLWSVESGAELLRLQVEKDRMMGSLLVGFLLDGKTISAIKESNVYLWNADTGNLKQKIKIGKSVSEVAFSPDGKTIAIAWGGDVDMRAVGIGNAASANGVRLFDVETGKEKESFGGEFKTFSNRIAGFKSVAYSKDGKYIAAGSFDGKVYLRDNETKILRKFEGHTDAVNSVKFAADAKGNLLVVSGSSDSTTRIWNAATGEEICALVTFRDGNWAVVQTKTGRYDAPNGGEIDGIQWVFGNEVIELSQLSAVYYTPNLLPRLLGYNKEPLYPVVALKDVKLYPEILEQKFDGKTGKLNIKLKNRGGGIGKTEVFVNGKRVVEDARDERLKQNPNVPIDTVVSLTVDVPPSAFVKGVENQIKIITSNYLKEIGKGNIQSRGVEVVHLDKGNAEFELPTLYAIVGGVSDYTGDALDLRFAAKDAEDFSNALRLGANRLFCPSNKAECLDKINITTLSTARQNAEEQPTKENFKKVFADIAAKAKPEDIFLVYLAGHGVTLGAGTDTYFYLTKDARAAGKTDLEKNFQTVAISSAELTDWLTPNKDNPNDIFVKALKQVVILDTCAAGNFAREDWKKDRDLSGDQIRAMEFLKDKTGTFILMGSASNAVSYEANRYNQGLLTYALLEGIKGFALQKATNNVDVRLLFDYAEKRVPDLAKDMNLDQRPIIKQLSGNTFLIGQMTDAEKTKINLPLSKPLLLRPLLTNPETGDDDLKLIPALRKMLDAESSYEVMQRSGKGLPILVYVDDDNFPGAVCLTGTYTVEGDKVKVKSFLRRDGKTITMLREIVADKDKVIDELLAAIRVELAKFTAS